MYLAFILRKLLIKSLTFYYLRTFLMKYIQKHEKKKIREILFNFWAKLGHVDKLEIILYSNLNLRIWNLISNSTN